MDSGVKEAAIRLCACYVGGECVLTALAKCPCLDQTLLTNQRPELGAPWPIRGVGNNSGVKRLLALVPADVALLLVASSSSYKIILILSIWKWFK